MEREETCKSCKHYKLQLGESVFWDGVCKKTGENKDILDYCNKYEENPEMCATCKHFTTDGAYKMDYDGFCMKNFWDVDAEENCDDWEKKEG